MTKANKVQMLFGKILPELTDTELDRLLAFGEGIAFKVHQEQSARPVPPLEGAARPGA